jgi:hypothetical protein
VKRALTIREGRAVAFARTQGIDYAPSSVEDVREEIIQARDDAVAVQDTGWGQTLSWVIAYLAEYADMLNDPRIVEVLEARRRVEGTADAFDIPFNV